MQVSLSPAPFAWTRSGVRPRSLGLPVQRSSANASLWQARSRDFTRVAVYLVIQIVLSSWEAVCCGLASSSNDSGQWKSAVKVSKSRHNSTTKLLIQNPPISFQDNTALSLHSTFQSLIFSYGWENANSYLAEWQTHLLTHTTTTVCLRGSAHRGIKTQTVLYIYVCGLVVDCTNIDQMQCIIAI